MYVEVAEIDNEGWKNTIHTFENVNHFHHERENPNNDWTALSRLLDSGEKTTVFWQGYGLEVAQVEAE